MSPIFFLCSVADTVKHFYWCFGNGLFFRCVIPDLWSCFLLRSCFLVWLKFNNWKNDKYTFLPGKLFFPWNNYWYLFSDKLYTENQGHFLVSGNVNIWGLFFFFFLLIWYAWGVLNEVSCLNDLVFSTTISKQLYSKPPVMPDCCISTLWHSPPLTKC